jgi:hypothetical protein
MIILEEPYVSEELKQYLEITKTPVLKNKMAIETNCGHDLNLLDPDEFKAALNSDKNLYTTSENALDWIYQNVTDSAMINSIDLMKDKIRFRETLSTMYPDFFFCKATLEELKKMDPCQLKMPLILKPAVGFFSVGVYTINSANDWEKAIIEITEQAKNWRDQFPDTVVGGDVFILEEYISGDEYAMDVYFDETGDPVILNIMKHDFSSSEDVSDRLYYTSKEIIEKQLSVFEAYLKKANVLLQTKNFPAHIEVRLNENTIIPIEFNPMRYAGWCTTDLAGFAFGLNTVDYFLNGKRPDWKVLLAGKEDKIYSMIVLNKPEVYGIVNGFDYNALCARFGKVLCLRKLDYGKYPTFGFLFTETDASDRRELDYIIRSDLTEFIN